MTVAEQIKRSTRPLTLHRLITAHDNSVRFIVLFITETIASAEYQFIDGSKLTCRYYFYNE